MVAAPLWLASHLGHPGIADAELSLGLVSDAPDVGNIVDPLGPEVDTAWLADGLPSVPASVKQPEDGDSSSASMAAPAQLAYESIARMVASLSREAAEPARPNGVPRYQVEDNHDVRRFLDQFQTGYRRAVVERWLVRAGRYLPMVLDVFKQKGLPEELVFTAMIESGFDPLAASRAGAKGLWQFMAPTARRYGLRIDDWLDERLDPEKSTVAAARHFVDLYAVFGSWNLAQAAYNAGERTVLEAIRAMGTSDFWALSRGRWLKDETKNFIPAIQAATLIAREPERYGFVVTPAPPLSYERVAVPRSTNLKQLAGKSGIDLDALERLNPELRLRQTPPEGPYHLKVPMGGATLIRTALERDATVRHVVAAPRPREHRGAAPAIHVVKARETVAGIAKRYGVTVADVIGWNDLDSTGRIRPGERLRVASRGRQQEEAQGGFR